SRARALRLDARARARLPRGARARRLARPSASPALSLALDPAPAAAHESRRRGPGRRLRSLAPHAARPSAGPERAGDGEALRLHLGARRRLPLGRGGREHASLGLRAARALPARAGSEPLREAGPRGDAARRSGARARDAARLRSRAALSSAPAAARA